jgi:hypothetical protein
MRSALYQGRPVVALLIVAASIVGARPAGAAEIRTLFSPFSGPAELGRSVGTILTLQFWQTLQKIPPGGSKRDLGDGSVYWVGRQLPIPDHETAARLAQAIDVTAQQVVWGHVHSFGQNALATSYLTLPDYADFRPVRNEVWALRLQQPGQSVTLTVDVPQRFYAFEPVVLASEFVSKYSAPDALVMRSGKKDSGAILGPIGARFDRIQSDGDYAQVLSNRKIGWVYLPQIGSQKPEIVDFLGGIMRIYRTDWEGAIELFGNVLKSKSAPTALRIDSYLYIIRAKSEIRQPADTEVNEVLALAPASRQAAQYVGMYYLARCPSLTGRGCRPVDRQFISRLPEKYGPLFEPDDRWLMQIKEIVRRG